MKRIMLLTCISLSAACTMNERPEAEREDDRTQLASALQGYEPAGPPVSCVEMRDLRGNRSAGESAILFEGNGGRLWVNRPAAGCPELDSGRALQTRTTATRLCRGDIATVFDPVSGVQYGGCGLGDFEPYRRLPR